MDLPVVNHGDYFAKIGNDHKFPINKFGELANYLIKKKIVEKFHKPYACSEETLKRVHSENYIKHIKEKTLDQNVIKKIGFPLIDSVVRRSLVATGGTAIACAELLTENFNVEKSDILILCIIDLPELGGSNLIKEQGYNIETLVSYWDLPRWEIL